jgi:hypothetical protein
MSKKYMIITNNIEQAIMDGRKAKWGNEQIVVITKHDRNETYDVTNMIDLAIAIKISKPNNRGTKDYFCDVVAFSNDTVTDETIEKAIDHLINFECKVPAAEGVPIAPRMIGTI